MRTNTRSTVADLATQVAEIRSAQAQLSADVQALTAGLTTLTQVVTARLTADEPAVPPADEPKAPQAPRTARKLTKAQERTWNRKIGSLASHGRPAGTHKALVARWDEARALRDAGKTPAQALKAMGF